MPSSRMPAATGAPEMPAVMPTAGVAPSAELGDRLNRMAEAQVEIDRKKARELARLRELQNCC